LNSNRIRVLLNCYCNSAADIKLKLLIFHSLKKGILEDWVFSEFSTPKYGVLGIKTLAKEEILLDNILK